MNAVCTEREFGKMPSGERVSLFELKNSRGMRALVTNYGAILTELHVPDKTGKVDNVVLGFDQFAPYLAKHPHLGGTIGRYANRIAGGSFELDGQKYTLVKNNGDNCLHGGTKGFDKQLWQVEDVGKGVTLSYLSADMEEGFPGNLTVHLTYELTEDNELRMEYRATTDKATVVNFTNHTYFNLKGAGNGDVLSHQLQLNADEYTPFNQKQIPTGEVASVEGTALDFRNSRAVGERIAECDFGGYDHNFVLRGSDGKAKNNSGELTLAAVVSESTSGRRLTVHTTEPGIQIYTGNNLNGSVTGLGGAYGKYSAICTETQHYPDSVHHPNFPNVILRPGEEYRQTTIFDFS